MNENIEFLNYILENAQMGTNTISQIIDIVKDIDISRQLKLQLNEYNAIYDSAKQKIQQFHGEIKDIGTLTKISTYIMININTLTNKTSSHIAEMLIQGSSMGIIDITKNLKKYKDADDDMIALGHRLLEFEQNNIEKLKLFL